MGPKEGMTQPSDEICNRGEPEVPNPVAHIVGRLEALTPAGYLRHARER